MNPPEGMGAAPGKLFAPQGERGEIRFLAALSSLYTSADSAVSATGVTCLGGGVCCKFDCAGHRLYLSTGELALLVRQPPPNVPQLDRGRCPYQVGPRCTARDRRPLGCRVFFCDPQSAAWSEALYERLHADIRRLHEVHQVSYVYMDLIAALGGMLCEGRYLSHTVPTGGKQPLDLSAPDASKRAIG